MSGGGKGKSVTVGYRYYMGIQYAICYGPVDALLGVEVDSRVAWTGNVTTTSTAQINAPGLFGGDKKEGGIQGPLYVGMGDASQAKNSYLVSRLGSNIPAYRGLLTAVFNGMVSAMNPYIKPWAFRVKRITQGWDGGVWYSAKAAIGNNMNPAHIVYECLTNREWGMGYPSTMLDSASFTAAADTLHAEGFGLSLIWNRSEKIRKFIGTVLQHIGGALQVDRKTGLFRLTLIRADYSIGSLPVIDVSNATLESWQRAAWGETANEITVVYTDPGTGKDRVVTVQDLANIDVQGATINRKANYPGITSDSIALRVAMRDLQQASTPLTKAKVKVNRDAWAWLPGDVVRLTWATMGIDAAYRVTSINWGTLQDNTITVDLAEDIFGLPQSSYGDQEPVGWQEPASLPAASPNRLVTETPYYELATRLSAADFAQVDATDCFLDVLARRPSSDALDYDLWTAAGSAALAEGPGGSHPTTAITTAALIAEETSVISVDSLDDLLIDPPTIGGFVVINGEYMRLDAYDVNAKTVTAARGVLDTVPQAHASGSILWFAYNYTGRDGVTYLPGDVVKIKVQTKTGRGELDIASAPQDTYTMAQRQARPYPPGLFRINSLNRPATLEGSPIPVSWAHRNRLTQTASLIAQGEASITPEAGTTYELELRRISDNALLASATGVTGTSSSLSPTGDGFVRLTLKAKRDGLDSWQSQTHEFEYVRTESRITEDGEGRITEAGEPRATE